MRRSLQIVLGRPDWWAISLAAFLVRGGILLVVVPILALPSIAALSEVFAPLLSGVVLSDSPISTVALLAGAAVVLAVALWITGIIGAWMDVALVPEMAQALGAEVRFGRPSLRDALNARLTAHVVTVLAAGFAVVRIVAAGYDELTAPTISASPLVVRVIARTPEAVVVLALAWAVAEAIGGLAFRRQVADGPARSAGGSIIDGIRGFLRPGALATLFVTDLTVVMVGIAVWVATSGTWTFLGDRLADGSAAPALGLGLLGFLVAWAAGLLLLGAALAFRAAAWTAEWLRHVPSTEAAPAVMEPA